MGYGTGVVRIRQACAAAACALALFAPTASAWAEAPLMGAGVDEIPGIEGISGSLAVGSADVTEAIGKPAASGESEAMPLHATRAGGTFYASMGGAVWQSEAHRMLAMVNNERARLGVPALQWDYELEQSAMQRAAETFIMFSHDRPDGSSCFTAFPSGLSMYGENIAMASFGNADNAYNMWYNSPGHYANMTHTGFTKVGIACFRGPDGVYWVQCLGAGGSSNTTASLYDGAASFAVPLPDSIITASYTSASALTPGVGALRVLPTVTFAFNGVVGNRRINGSATYGNEMFSWRTDDERIAGVGEHIGSRCCIGVAPGRTTLHAEFPSSSRLNKDVPVIVTREGAFIDVDANTPHRDAVLFMSSLGVTAGYADGSFKPYVDVARADMAAFLRRFAIASGVEGADSWQPSQADWNRFSDVHQDTPHAQDILWLAHAGISTGFDDATFRPFASVTRCDMAAFLRRFGKVAGIESALSWTPSAGDYAAFPDVAATTPHRDDILWLAHCGVSTGFPDGTFAPYAIVKRCDMAAFLKRVSELLA